MVNGLMPKTKQKSEIMKKWIYGIAALSVLWVGCGKEDELEPSGADINWFVVEDSTDPVDHLRFEVFEEFGVPVYYNDTIGSMEMGIDVSGNPRMFYRVIDCNYSITDRTILATYGKSKDRDAIQIGVEVIRDQVLSVLPAKLRPRSMLVVDNLNVNERGNQNGEAGAFKAMMTTVMGRLNVVKTMTDIEKKSLAAEVLGEIVGHYLYSNCAEELIEFYGVSIVQARNGSDFNLYEQNIWQTTSTSRPEFKNWMDYGFFSYDSSRSFKETDYYCINQVSDLVDYMTEVFKDDDAMFQTTYASYPVILQKYEIIKAVWEKVKTGL